ncbi:Site-specific DNA recombinase [Clostridium acidisoli DSM 12555]|uniref:Site-specific DNA recombinase n=1 Tax=Clostridium acidisoli DSM 12555 TaxID=1121291 RepID=A0A1W1X043_9CLOT|nr:recombinase family protein [Clostridium acidisoli]SMC17068.1 Site-specific DNA recombinase [Clostridium acidisoli DSM 12555]
MKIAIYSRKSKFTGKGDSIENQIEMCKDYISKYVDKNVEFIIYEDEGFSGGTIDRPKFKKLMHDVQANTIDKLVCYRLDRISRNVADFSSTLEILQNYHVDFISISEQFDTSTPMGRAMIYIASVFAQLERETIAERVKDNMMELAKNGRWTGGKIPLGFISNKKVYIDEEGLKRQFPVLEIEQKEMSFVELLYNKYLELGSLHKLEVYVTENQLKSRNDVMLEKSSLKLILQNPIYVKANDDVLNYLQEHDYNVYGKPDGIHSLLTYNKTEQSMKNGKHVKIKKAKEDRLAAISNIEGALPPALWLDVQRKFDENRDKFPRLGKTNNALLTGKIKCGKCNEYMLIQHGKVSKTTGQKSFYYVCSLKRKSHKKLCDCANANASKLEDLVLLSLKKLSKAKLSFISDLKKKYNSEWKNNGLDEKLMLTKALSDKKKQISNLLNELSKEEDEYMKGLIRDKIKPFKKQCMQLEHKLVSLETETKKSKTNEINLKIIEDILNDCEIIDKLPRERQKQIIDTIIETIYWFGESNNSNNGRIKIKFIGTDNDYEEMNFTDKELEESKLQFSSTSTCKINDNFLSIREIKKNTRT